MKYLILGSNGFLGSKITSFLKEEGKNFIGIDRHGQQGVDLSDQASVYNLLVRERPEIIINCAGCVENSEKAITSNPIITLNILQSLVEANQKNLKKIIIIGSASEYGIVEECGRIIPLKGKNYYAMSKIMEVSVAKRFKEEYKLPVIIARLFNPIGPGLKADRFLIPIILNQIKEVIDGIRDSIEVTRLDSKRDYVDASDTAELIIKIAEKKENKYDNYDIGSGISTTNEELVKKLIELRGLKELKIKELRNQKEPDFACKADINRIKEEFKDFKFKDLEFSLRNIIDKEKEAIHAK